MIQSMTGFARSSVTTAAFAVIVELRSVNSRYLDLIFRCPDSLRSQEALWRRTLGQQFARGKIEVAVRVQPSGQGGNLEVSDSRLTELAAALAQVAVAFPDSPQPNRLALLQAPGVMAESTIDEATLTAAANTALNDAIEQLCEQRGNEGSKLVDMVYQRTNAMATILTELRQHLPQLREQQRQRLLDRLQQVGVEADDKRLEEELVYLAQRSDVDEEMDRLDAHLEAINSTLATGKPCGRKLDFLMQELNREANTLSSKSTALTTTNTAVEFKVLIEQMREQIQNIE